MVAKETLLELGVKVTSDLQADADIILDLT
jgi:hypothetical protein